MTNKLVSLRTDRSLQYTLIVGWAHAFGDTDRVTHGWLRRVHQTQVIYTGDDLVVFVLHSRFAPDNIL